MVEVQGVGGVGGGRVEGGKVQGVGMVGSSG